MLFWSLAVLLAVLAAALATRPLWSGRRAAAARAAHDVTLYKGQLAEVERDLARGSLSEAEAVGARREISRRLLAADETAAAAADFKPAPERFSRAATIAVTAASLVGGLALYAELGAPSMPGMPLTGRDFASERRTRQPTQAAAEAELARARALGQAAPAEQNEPSADIAEIIARMEGLIEQRPKDAQGRILLAEAYMKLGREAEAWPLYAQAIALLGAAAEPDLHARLGEAMTLAAGGVVSREAEAALRAAPDAPRSRYFLGLAAAQSEEYHEAIEAWASLYREFPGAPFASALLNQIATAAEALGADPAGVVASVRGDPPAGAAMEAPGPTGADMAAAAEMSPEERQGMIESMVAGLAARLEQNPNDPEGWARLIRSYSVLGRPEEAQAALAKARTALAGDAEALARLEAATSGAPAAGGAAPAQAGGSDIDAMVAGLAARLEREPNDLEGWLKLIRSHAALGRPQEARDAYAKAKAAFAENSEALMRLDAAGLGAPDPAAGLNAPVQNRPGLNGPAQNGPGPNAADVAAAATMAPADRQGMIEGMVAGLASRLEQNPDDLEGWLKLIRSYAVLGRPEDARAALGKAETAFAQDAPALERLAAAALDAGIRR